MILILIAFNSNIVEAQFIKEKSINAQIGYGLSAPNISLDEIVDNGFFAQGELVLKVKSWIEFTTSINQIIHRPKKGALVAVKKQFDPSY